MQLLKDFLGISPGRKIKSKGSTRARGQIAFYSAMIGIISFALFWWAISNNLLSPLIIALIISTLSALGFYQAAGEDKEI